METSLLKTKLNIPPFQPSLVSRPRLTQQLQEGLSCKFLLISAPAGFGKTTLLSEWARQSIPHMRTAWVSLDEGDNDPVRFWEYFIAALKTLHPAFGESFKALLHSSQLPPIEALMTVLINELTSISFEFFIVLDDYHVITSQPINDGIAYLLEYLPPRMHLVIASRADPPLPLAHFRGKGTMLEIHTDDLRFSRDEAMALLEKMKSPALSIDDVNTLEEKTEGWAVGLKMVALSLQHQKDIPGFIASFTGSQRYIMDYLMEEVLRQQTEEVEDFILKTSVLERFTAPLCDAITGRKDSKDILLNLEHRHLFIVPLDESRQWYRYEHLFRDLLSHQLEVKFGVRDIAALHRQASQWYEDNNLPDEAIHHALEAKDWQSVMRLIDAHGQELRKRGEFITLLGWLQAIPHEILRGHLRLYNLYAALLVAVGQLDAAEAALSYLEAVAPDDTALQGEVALTRGTVYRYRGDVKRCIELFEKAFDLLPPDDVAMRCRAALGIAHARQRYGPAQEAERWATRACELGQQAGDILAVTFALSQLGIIAIYQGKLRRAVQMFQKENEIAGETVPSGKAYDMLCWVQYILNDLEAAAENARLAIEAAELSGWLGPPLVVIYYQVQMCLARGDVAGAAAAMERLDQASRHPSVDAHWHAFYIYGRIIYAIQRGDVEDAARWGQQLPEAAFMLIMIRYVPARLLLAQGKKEAAARLLQELYEKSTQSGVVLAAMQISIYQALAADNDESALDFLAEALASAAPEGVIRYFVDEGKLIKPLLEKALIREITPRFTRKLLDIIEEEERQRQASKRAAAPPPPPGLLSERELEVLRLLAGDIPNQRIAAKLSVSLGTVKTHVHHIIEKLEVKDHRQAVQRARELKLL